MLSQKKPSDRASRIAAMRPRPRNIPRRRKGQPGFWTGARRLMWSWWFWALICVAGVYVDRPYTALTAGIVAAFTYLVTPQEQSPRYGLDTRFSVESPAFVSSFAGATGVPLVDGNSIRILNNGDEFFPSMLEAIAGARHSITMEVFIYWAGDIGERFARELSKKARHGVKVKILLDAVGCTYISKEILRLLSEGGCQVDWYNPVRWTTIGRINYRTHRKSLVIDGRVAFTGGAGIADHWMGHAQSSKHWRDIQVRIEGPAAVPLQTGFAQNWLNTTGELISGPEYFPNCEPAGPYAVQTILSSPEGGSSSVRILHYLAIVCARRRIFLANPYFIPDETGRDILIDAKRRGVDVKIMLAGKHNDTMLGRYGSMHLYGKFLEAGIEIYEYERTMMHQKMMVIDSLWATIGTTNFDNRSFALNEESNICLYDRRVAAEMEELFLHDLKECKRIELDAWRNRGLLAKVQGTLALMMKEQI
jgi:cardiolipin synthase